MSIDRLVSHLIDLSNREASSKATYLSGFTILRKAGSLIEPARKVAEHHRDRERHYTQTLEIAEKKLRDEGITVEMIDQKTGYAYQGSICSGNIAMPGGMGAQNLPKFQPKVDQDLMGKVETAKVKMLEHREKAERFEKYARAFACAPHTEVTLNVEEVHQFRLEQ